MKKLLLAIALIPCSLGYAQETTPSPTSTFRVKTLAYDVLSGNLLDFRNDIFVMEFPKPKPRRVAAGTNPVLSPDGQKIAYCVRSGLGTRHIGIQQMHVINVDGSSDQQITNLVGGACPSDWSADGRLAFVSNGGIYVMGGNGEYWTRITGGGMPRWSPDGKKLVFIRAGDTPKSSDSIWIIDSDGTNERKIIEEDSQVLEANWGADKNSILFTSARGRKDRSEIFSVNLDGSNRHPFAADKHSSLFFPIASPDGSMLIVDGIDSDEKTVLLLDVASHHKTVLATGLHPSVLWQSQ